MGEDNILVSIKKMLGLDPSDDSFDIDIIININTVFDFLVQLGVNSFYTVYLHTGNEKWSDYIDPNQLYRLIITYTYLKVKDYFDPPTSGVLREAMERQIRELEWRIKIMVGEMELRKGDGSDDEDILADAWYNIVLFIQGQHNEGHDTFQKGMDTPGLSDTDVTFFHTESLMYAFLADDDIWTYQNDNGEYIKFLCTAGTHKDRDYKLIYHLNNPKKAAWVKEFISTPDYELAQKLIDLPVGGNLNE